ncbi:29534_t:CDS:1, partial [Gigaspora margarita]
QFAEPLGQSPKAGVLLKAIEQFKKRMKEHNIQCTIYGILEKYFKKTFLKRQLSVYMQEIYRYDIRTFKFIIDYLSDSTINDITNQ